MSKQNFSSLDSLKSVERVLNEANEALNNKTFTIDDSAIPEVLVGALGAGIGGAASFVALSTLGVAGLSAAGITSGLATAGGGTAAAAAAVGIGVAPMVAGIAVLAAPAVLLAAIGVGIASSAKHKKLIKEKTRLFAKVTETLHAIATALKNEVNIVKKRADALNAYNILLTQALKDLKADLGL